MFADLFKKKLQFVNMHSFRLIRDYSENYKSVIEEEQRHCLF